MGPQLNLKNVRISTIVPSETTEHPAVIESSLIDNIGVLDCYVSFVYFYRPENSESDGRKLGEVIKESLSKALVPFYPLAGRWVRTYDARLRVLQCTDEGVPFIEADVDEEMDSLVDIEDYKELSGLGGYEMLGLDEKSYHQDVDTPLPSLFIQMTRFKCGGIAVHTACNHQTSDGVGFFRFVTAWAEISTQGQTTVLPVHDRCPFQPFLQSVGCGVLSQQDFDREKLMAAKSDPAAGFKLPRESLQTASRKMLHVKRESIERLKKEAEENGIRLSTSDLIAAHLWRASSKPTSMQIAVNGRNVLHSPLASHDYSGNAFVMMNLPFIPRKDLEASSDVSVATTIRYALQQFRSKSWTYAMTEQLSDMPPDRLRLISVSWYRLPMYELTFGCGYGKPVLCGCNHVPSLPPFLYVVVVPPAPSLSKDVVATVNILGSQELVSAYATDLLSSELSPSIFR